MDLRPTPDDNMYHDRFTHERERLLAALGAMTEGGIVEAVEHVGATSAPGLLGRPIMDIALSVWPFPLENAAHAALTSLGYALDSASGGEPEQRLLHASQDTSLYIVASGSPQWTDYLLLRDHLRHDPATRDDYSIQKRAWSAGAASEADYTDAERRAWLGWALTAYAPEHPWIARL